MSSLWKCPCYSDRGPKARVESKIKAERTIVIWGFYLVNDILYACNVATLRHISTIFSLVWALRRFVLVFTYVKELGTPDIFFLVISPWKLATPIFEVKGHFFDKCSKALEVIFFWNYIKNELIRDSRTYPLSSTVLELRGVKGQKSAIFALYKRLLMFWSVWSEIFTRCA